MKLQHRNNLRGILSNCQRNTTFLTAFLSFKAYQMTFGRIVDGSSGEAGRIQGNIVNKIFIQEIIATTVTVIQIAVCQLVHVDDLLRFSVFGQIEDTLIRIAVDFAFGAMHFYVTVAALRKGGHGQVGSSTAVKEQIDHLVINGIIFTAEDATSNHIFLVIQNFINIIVILDRVGYLAYTLQSEDINAQGYPECMFDTPHSGGIEWHKNYSSIPRSFLPYYDLSQFIPI